MDSLNKDMMNVIFLDNDGVICLYNNWGGRGKKWSKYRSANPESSQMLKDAPVEIRFDDFDQKAIKILNKILEETGAEIVVSSDWKLHATLEELGDYYEAQGIIKRPIAITPNLHEFEPETNGLFMWKRWLERKRILEIEKYLKDTPGITNWVAVDDLNMSPEANGGHGLQNFVLTPRSTEGIKQSDIKEKIIQFLTKI
jgi:tetratricopeptide (TPR) repeat protein